MMTEKQARRRAASRSRKCGICYVVFECGEYDTASPTELDTYYAGNERCIVATYYDGEEEA